MDKELYKVTGGYTDNPRLFTEDYYETYQDASNRLANPWPLDWMRYDVIEDNEENRTKMKANKEENEKVWQMFVKKNPHIHQNLSEGPYNEFKVDGVGQGSLRGH